MAAVEAIEEKSREQHKGVYAEVLGILNSIVHMTVLLLEDKS